VRSFAIVMVATVLGCTPPEPPYEPPPAPPSDDDDSAVTVEQRCPDGMLRIEGDTFEIGESDEQWIWDGGTILTVSLTVSTFCVDTLPFPGVEGAAWPIDGLAMALLLDLEPILTEAGRRLCTATELTVATAGPDNLRFGYGDEHQPGRCPADDFDPEPLGDRPDCLNALGLRDFGVRSTWVRLDAPMRDALAEYGAPTVIPGEPPGPGNYGGDLPYTVHGGTSRLNTFYAPTAIGIHGHNWDKDYYIDDGLRVCADPSEAPEESSEAWGGVLDSFFETGTYGGLLES
jgi:hypothetical protein